MRMTAMRADGTNNGPRQLMAFSNHLRNGLCVKWMCGCRAFAPLLETQAYLLRVAQVAMSWWREGNATRSPD